ASGPRTWSAPSAAASGTAGAAAPRTPTSRRTKPTCRSWSAAPSSAGTEPGPPRAAPRRGFCAWQKPWIPAPPVRFPRHMSTRGIRFGVNFREADLDDWPRYCRDTERLGYDTLLAPDHLGHPAPFGMLAAAAAATDHIRLGTMVLNNEFWNPALLAREAATVDRISRGRLELGLGLGHMKSEFETAGIPWRGHADRLAALERTLGELDRFLVDGGPGHGPAQRPRPPLLIGGHGEATLRLAARRADIIGFGGLVQRRGAPMGVFHVEGPDDVLRRVDFVREQAGG